MWRQVGRRRGLKYARCGDGPLAPVGTRCGAVARTVARIVMQRAHEARPPPSSGTCARQPAVVQRARHQPGTGAGSAGGFEVVFVADAPAPTMKVAGDRHRTPASVSRSGPTPDPTRSSVITVTRSGHKAGASQQPAASRRWPSRRSSDSTAPAAAVPVAVAAPTKQRSSSVRDANDSLPKTSTMRAPALPMPARNASAAAEFAKPASSHSAGSGRASSSSRSTDIWAGWPSSASRSATYNWRESQCAHRDFATVTGSLPAHSCDTMG